MGSFVKKTEDVRNTYLGSRAELITKLAFDDLSVQRPNSFGPFHTPYITEQ